MAISLISDAVKQYFLFPLSWIAKWIQMSFSNVYFTVCKGVGEDFDLESLFGIQDIQNAAARHLTKSGYRQGALSIRISRPKTRDPAGTRAIK